MKLVKIKDVDYNPNYIRCVSIPWKLDNYDPDKEYMFQIDVDGCPQFKFYAKTWEEIISMRVDMINKINEGLK